MKSLRGTLVVCVVVAAAALSSCKASVSFGNKTLDKDKLETSIATQLQQEVGAEQAPIIDCPNGLKAKVDAVTHCNLATKDSPDEVYDVRVTVTKVNGDDVRYDIKVADEPNPS